MKIRIATKSDIDFILRGIQENAHLSFPLYRKNSKTETIHRRRIREALKDKQQKFFIALISRIPCGFIWLRLETTEISLERFGYLQSIWVYRKLRRRGVANALLFYIMRFLKKNKYRKIRTTYTVSNLSIKNFLRKNGFHIRRSLVEKGF
jgi:ribosomal protein S18 acetylase RimI-like enzyme